MLFIGSIAAVRLRPAGRPILLFWAICSLAMGIGGCYFYVRWLIPPWRDQLGLVRGVVDSMVSFAGWGIGTTLAIVMLYLLTRPKIKQAFESSGRPEGV
jgi:hypothetical protein